MSSLFQGLAGSAGSLLFTTDPAGTSPYRGGLLANAAGHVLIAPDTGQARSFHSGRAFDQTTGALLVDPAVIDPVLGMGGMTVDQEGGVIVKTQPPDVIHQGVGLTAEGYICGSVAEPNVTFNAPLTENTGDIYGAPSTFIRSTDGLFQDATQPAANLWQIAGPNVPRFEEGKILMEPARTNRPQTHNSSPASTAGWNGTASRSTTLYASELASQGLSAIQFDDRVLRFTSSGNQFLNCNPFFGQGANFWSMWANTANTEVTWGFENDTIFPLTTSSFQRVTFRLNRVQAGSRRVEIRFDSSGGEINFCLFQVEAGNSYTNPIITERASTSRGADVLSWGGATSFINPSEGSLVIEYNPLFNRSDTGVDHDIVTLQGSSGGFLYETSTNTFSSSDGVNTASVTIPEIVRDDTFTIALLWGPTTIQVGFKKGAGTWTWGATTPYVGAYPNDGTMRLCNATPNPARARNLIIYNINQGTAWIEANY